MRTIVNLEIAPASQAWVTPLEVLEDFADAVPSWFFLEDESRHYAVAKAVPACVIRSIGPSPQESADLAFAAVAPSEFSPMRLLLVDADDRALEEAQRERIVRRFLHAFRTYLRNRASLVEIRTEEHEPAMYESMDA